MTGPREVRIVLDASAIVAFTRESIHVGEVIAEVDQEGGAVGLPVMCLVEAVHAVADTGRLDILVNHPATALFTTNPSSWQALAATYDIVGRLDAATAVLAAVDMGVDVLTRQAGLYAGIAGGGPVIPF